MYSVRNDFFYVHIVILIIRLLCCDLACSHNLQSPGSSVRLTLLESTCAAFPSRLGLQCWDGEEKMTFQGHLEETTGFEIDASESHTRYKRFARKLSSGIF